MDLKQKGTEASINDRLNILLRMLASSEEQTLRPCPEMLFGPAAFLGSKFL